MPEEMPSSSLTILGLIPEALGCLITADDRQQCGVPHNEQPCASRRRNIQRGCLSIVIAGKGV